jgi:hypothetical protein
MKPPARPRPGPADRPSRAGDEEEGRREEEDRVRARSTPVRRRNRRRVSRENARARRRCPVTRRDRRASEAAHWAAVRGRRRTRRSPHPSCAHRGWARRSSRQLPLSVRGRSHQSDRVGTSRAPQSRHRRAEGTVAVVAVGWWTTRICVRHSGQNIRLPPRRLNTPRASRSNPRLGDATVDSGRGRAKMCAG